MSDKGALKFVFLRLFIGVFFIAVGTDKILHPYESFLYVIQEYRLFPDMLEELVARVFPWIELFLGLFLSLGLWLKWTLRAFLLVVGAFILIITQALLRKLPISDCGCFGGLFASDIRHTLFIDVSLLLFLRTLQSKYDSTSRCSLDRYFDKTKV